MSTAGKLHLLTILLALVVSTCTDFDPVAVDDTHPEPTEQDPFPSFAAQSVGSQGANGRAEPFRHRLSINLSFEGELVPNETITLRLHGVASKDLTGGEVRVMLPTKAAMDHAGAGRYPSYPVGQQIPAVARWNVSAMSTGDSWAQSVDITLPGKGYYQVAVMVAAQAPSGQEDPFVVDEFDMEQWLLVKAGGGQVTYFLDSDMVPDGIITGEGPFRRAPAVTSRPSGGGSADGDDDISLHAIYYESGARRNAKDAEMRIEYRDQVDEPVRTYTVTVPSNGVVTVDCPDSYEYVVASVLVPNTSKTLGRYLIGGTEVYNSDCGTTRTLQSNAYIFIPWRNLKEVIPIIEDYFGEDRSAVKWAQVFADSAAGYYPKSDSITFGYTYYGNKWIAAHEYGHAYHHKALGGITGTDDCRDHERDKPSSYQCAFSEGFADYAGHVGTGHPAYWEDKHYTEPGHDDAEIEGNFAALLHDLIDSAEDGNDETNYPEDFVADVFKTCRANGIERNDVTDFVWCMEDRINANVHAERFPNGPSAPSSVSRSATNPSSFNADDVRDTWIQNIG